MKRLVGTYYVGTDAMKVFVDTELLGGTGQLPGSWSTGGQFDMGELVIGIADEDWSVAVENLFHEAFEYWASRQQFRFEPDQNVGRDSSNCLFVMTHAQFTETMARVSMLFGRCGDALMKEHKKFHGSPKKKK